MRVALETETSQRRSGRRGFFALLSLAIVSWTWGSLPAQVAGSGAAETASPTSTPAPALPQAPAAVAGMDLAALRRLTNSGHAAEALTQLDALAKQQPVPGGVDRSRGVALYSLDRLPEAEAAFAQALVRNPEDAEAAQMRGLTLFRLGRPAAAIPLLEHAHTGGVQDKADPSYVLALCYLDTRRYDDARRAFAAQFNLPPESAPAYLVAARMLLRREYVPVAEGFATRALELDPQLPLAHELLGEIALAGNHLDEAIAEFEKERARNPVEGSSYERLGDAYSRAARYPEAARVLQQAVLLEPNSTGPYILLGKVMLKQGDAVGARTFLEKAERMDPANFMTHNLLAQAYRGLGRTADASRELELTEKIQAADEPKPIVPQ